MSERKAKAARRERVEQGLDPFGDKVHNFLPEEAEDTRRMRRQKKFRKAVHAAELKATNVRTRMAEINKWNRALVATALAKAELEMAKAAEQALAEIEAKEEEITA